METRHFRAVLVGFSLLLVYAVNAYFSASHQFGFQPETESASTVGEARTIIEQSYLETFAPLAASCPNNVAFRDCVKDFADSVSTKNETVPWWFHKMLIDTTGRNGVMGNWHELNSRKVRMCAIEKIGTKQWQKLFRHLNADTVSANATLQEQNLSFKLRNNASTALDDLPIFVFLRDPLERFLSAFMDKCVSWHRKEGHCQPTEVFQKDGIDAPLVIDLTPKQKFAAFVDVIALNMNMHFYPQSFFCNGLYRQWRKFDFVGIMGSNFYHDLYTLGKRFDLEEEISVVFGDLFSLMNKSNVGVETSAPDHVKEYYTPQSLRRVLQYVGMDYMLLDLPLPNWADQMLEEES